MQSGVSILVLVDVSLEVYIIICKNNTIQFQSLFSWMFRSKWELAAFPYAVRGFNPCSRGCFARSVYHNLQEQHHPVSILVLVDVSLEVELAAFPYAVMGFQSLFSWMFRSKCIS